jgi:hemolysin III
MGVSAFLAFGACYPVAAALAKAALASPEEYAWPGGLRYPVRPLRGKDVDATSTGRPQSLGEEIANAISHGAGAVAALVALPVLVVNAVTTDRPAIEIFGVSVFGATAILMYLISTLYHALPAESSGASGRIRSGRAKRVFWVLDHSAIYLLIAGTYTPFALGVFKDSWGWPMFFLVWGLAAAGVLLKCLGGGRHPLISSGLYLGMGWLVLGAAEPLFRDLPHAGFLWLLAGGVAYTLGVIFYALDSRLRYAHFGWHLFVLAGTACHFVAVLGYA